jgi:hypothetical protein
MIVFTHELVAAIIATGSVATAIGAAFAAAIWASRRRKQ